MALQKDVNALNSKVQKIDFLPGFFSTEVGASLHVLRLDQWHPQISGNKWFKLKHNLAYALEHKVYGIHTYGGAFSNYVYALSAACAYLQIPLRVGIRGEEHVPLNSTLKFVSDNGHEIYYIDRKVYRTLRHHVWAEEPLIRHGILELPEGGSNQLGVIGCMDILSEELIDEFDVFVLCAGTGATAAGILCKLGGRKKLVVVPVLKANFFEKEINAYTRWVTGQVYSNYEIWANFHFGGYAKYNASLISFLEYMLEVYNLPLERVYTGKMFYALKHQRYESVFSGKQKVLAIHTGGLRPNT